MNSMQLVDFTTLTAVRAELCREWIPARLEQVYQSDRHTIFLALRTMTQRGWLTIAWHPEGARVCLGEPPPRIPDTFTFSEQLRAKLNGCALIKIETIAPWERVLDLQFAKRPGDLPLYHLYVEIMGKYSNVILTDGNNQIISVAYQVSSAQSSMRTVQTGQIYQPPPPMLTDTPDLEETLAIWQQKVSLIPGKLQGQLLKTYRGISPTVVDLMLEVAHLDGEQCVTSLTTEDWQRLFLHWQEWLKAIASSTFTPGWTEKGYTVLGWGITKTSKTVQALVNSYYTQELNQQGFRQLRHQLLQKLANLLKKLHLKADTYQKRLQQSDTADEYRQRADLLMAYLHLWQPGMKSITLEDFETGKPIKINLNPEKNAVGNAQFLYKQQQKLKRVRSAVEPLLEGVLSEINYLEQVEASLNQVEEYKHPQDLKTLEEIREELINQGYLEVKQQRSRTTNEEIHPHIYRSPSSFELWIGRNNRQNDQLTFRIASDYDLWFHTQEIPGSHVLLRIPPGKVAEEVDLQFAADLAAYYSRARQSEQVSVVCTQPKYVYKPKGAKPGMVIYKRETILWGHPLLAKNYAIEGLYSTTQKH
jgi:predicted ribosome quality control (RQC) complex YloA/Tae2 family protein